MISSKRSNGMTRLWTLRAGARTWLILTSFLFTASHQGAVAATTPLSTGFSSKQVAVKLPCGPGCLWAFTTPDRANAHSFAPPSFEVNGHAVPADVDSMVLAGSPLHLANGAVEYDYEGKLLADPHLHLAIQFQVNDETPVIRFRYKIRSERSDTLTKNNGVDALTYFQTSLGNLPNVDEVLLSNFAELTHSFTLTENHIDERYFQDHQSAMGPILTATDGDHSFLLAYEHGSQTPDAFLQYKFSAGHQVELAAVKGNYIAGESIGPAHGYTTVWIETAAVAGSRDQLASAFRRFLLQYQSENASTRLPYIFYNTWNFQERNKWNNGKAYLDSMNQARILEEIEIAHRMGIEVFVLDTGWYGKTGDWAVSTARFPDGLKEVKATLDRYGMKLGLWFGPTSAAVSSKMVVSHPEWRMSVDGKIPEPTEVWETEKSYRMCMVSGYADAFADELIRLAREVGVVYFKWDAIGQYGCNDPHHNHGTSANTSQERSDAYGFQLVQAMSYVAEKVSAAVPGTIVDFDVTEGGRAMGLAFLAAGKYFLINNGPYLQSYDVPIDLQRENSNLFFHPGPARTWITRTPLTFDKWIPSVLFLTHYFPDDPLSSQEVNVASLILGQNGIWGDLPKVSAEGVRYIGAMLARYKQVRGDMTESDPVVSGIVSGSPEIHEKISTTTGKGAVVIFATAPGTYRYVTAHRTVADFWKGDGVTIERDAAERAIIQASFTKPGARIIFFGVR